MAVMAKAAAPVVAVELITETADGASYNLPEVNDIAKYSQATCGQLIDELQAKQLIEGPIEGFAKMAIGDKRDCLTKIIKSLTGVEDEPVAEAAPATEAKSLTVAEQAQVETIKANITPSEKPKAKPAAAKPATEPATETATAAAMAAAVKPKPKPSPKPKAETKPAETKPAAVEKKEAPKAAAKSNELLVAAAALPADDLIAKTAQAIDKRVKNRSSAEENIRELLDDDDFSEFKLGGLLAKLQTNPDWWKESYQSFKDYLETAFGLKYGKAMYCVRIYRRLLTLGVPWTSFQNIGWTKVNLLCDIVTPENVEEWVEKAKAMNTISLEAAISAALQKEPAAAGANETSNVTTVTFKVHPDQKVIINEALEKAKATINTSVASVALEGICQTYMGDGVAFKDWKSAMMYARKHSDDPALFAGEAISFLEEICPELVISASLEVKGHTTSEL